MTIKRVLAYLIDLLFVLILIFFIPSINSALLGVFISYAYFLFTEKFFSCTAGKSLLGLRTTSTISDNLSWQQASLRAILKYGTPLFWLVIVIAFIFAKDKQNTWYDKLTCTRISKKKEIITQRITDFSNHNSFISKLHKSFTAQIIFVISLLIFLYSIQFVFDIVAFKRSKEFGNTMSPTVNKGDRIYAKDILNLKTTYKRGDIVSVFPPYFPNKSKDQINFEQTLSWYDKVITGHLAALVPLLGDPEISIKRIVGLPNEEIEIIPCKGVFINGKLLNTNYSKFYTNVTKAYPKTKIPDNYYFILCDNVNNCSEYYGLIPKDRFCGLIYKITKP